MTGVEAEPGSERSHLTALLADLPEDSRLAERSATREVVLIQRPDALRDRAAEPPDLGDLRCVHSLILVRDHFYSYGYPVEVGAAGARSPPVALAGLRCARSARP